MELHGSRLIPAPLATTWAALNDPAQLKVCIAGCESLERTGDDAYSAVVALRIGPVSARFKGNLTMTNVDAPNRYTIAFDGQGGVAGFGKGSADVKLAAEGDAATRLTYDARAQVGGKMAQIGSRLIDATASKITDDFFKAFEAHLRAQTPAPVDVMDGVGATDVAAEAAAPVAPVAPAADPPRVRIGTPKLGWALAAAAVLVTAYAVTR